MSKNFSEQDYVEHSSSYVGYWIRLKIAINIANDFAEEFDELAEKVMKQ